MGLSARRAAGLSWAGEHPSNPGSWENRNRTLWPPAGRCKRLTELTARALGSLRGWLPPVLLVKCTYSCHPWCDQWDNFSPTPHGLHCKHVLLNLASFSLTKHYPQLPAGWENGQQITKQVCVSEEFPTNQWGG